MGETAIWTPTTFEISIAEAGKTSKEDRFSHMQTVAGETWGVFGVHADSDETGTDWVVTHLPTGRMMVAAETRPAARRFCEEVAPLADWPNAKPGRIPQDARDAVLEAWHRARGAMFTSPPDLAPAVRSAQSTGDPS